MNRDNDRYGGSGQAGWSGRDWRGGERSADTEYEMARPGDNWRSYGQGGSGEPWQRSSGSYREPWEGRHEEERPPYRGYERDYNGGSWNRAGETSGQEYMNDRGVRDYYGGSRSMSGRERTGFRGSSGFGGERPWTDEFDREDRMAYERQRGYDMEYGAGGYDYGRRGLTGGDWQGRRMSSSGSRSYSGSGRDFESGGWQSEYPRGAGSFEGGYRGSRGSGRGYGRGFGGSAGGGFERGEPVEYDARTQPYRESDWNPRWGRNEWDFYGMSYPGGSSGDEQSRGYGGDMNQGPHYGRGPRGYQRSDERIREDVSQRLYDHEWMDASELEVQVNGGVVTLSGEVDDRFQKRMAEDIAERVTGVKDVHNQLRVHDHRQSMSGMQQGSSGSGTPYGGGGSAAGSQGSTSGSRDKQGSLAGAANSTGHAQ